MKKTMLFAALALSTAIVAPATAATIIPVSGVGSSSYPSYGGSNAVDGNVLTDWASNSQGVGSSILFDLGGSYFLSGANLADRVTSGGGNGGYVGGFFDFTTAFTLTYYGSNNVALGSQSFSRTPPVSPTGPNDFAGSFVVNQAGKISSVRYTVDAANGVNPGLSEASFIGSVPEPATWGMMLVGFGLVGAGLRSRRKESLRVTYA